MKKHILFVTALCAFSLALAGCMDLFDKGSYTPGSEEIDWTHYKDGKGLWVSDTGSDASGNGTPDAPFQSFNHIWSQIAAEEALRKETYPLGYQPQDYTITIIGSVTSSTTLNSSIEASKLSIVGTTESGTGNAVWNSGSGTESCFRNEGATSCPVLLRNITFTGVTGGTRSPVYNGDGCSLTMIDCEIKDNVFGDATQTGGGGLYNAGKAYLLGTVSITNNSAKAGGGIHNTDTGELYLGSAVPSTILTDVTSSTITIADNVARLDYGAGIRNAGKLVIGSTTVIRDNQALEAGGGIAVTGSSATCTLKDGVTITDNTADSGAGIYIDALSGAVSISNTIFEGNSATEKGGAIYNLTAENLTIGEYSGIFANIAANGAGLYNTGTVVINEGALFSGNKSSENGGGIYNASGATLNLDGGSIGKADAPNTAVLGGGIYTEGTFTMTRGTIGDSSATTTATLVVDSEGAITGSYANLASYGGGLYGAAGSTVAIEGGTVSYNYAYTYVAPPDEDLDGNLDWDEDPTLDVNYGGSGGAIWFETGSAAGSLIIRGGHFTYNAVHAKGTHSDTERNGGVLFLTGSGEEAVISGGTFYGNWARNGGVLYEDNGTLNISGGYFGCGVFNASEFFDENGDFDPTGATKKPNIALDGGALIVNDVATCNMTGGVMCGNMSRGVSVNGGGAVYLYGTMTMSGSAIIGYEEASYRATKEFCANFSTNFGGGIMLDDGYLTLENSLTGGIYQNYSVALGGGIYFSHDIDDEEAFFMHGGTFAYNTACEEDGTGGGGIAIAAGYARIDGGNVAKNYVYGDTGDPAKGGGILNGGYLYIGGNLVIGDNTKSDTATEDSCSNYSYGYGAGISNYNESRLYILEFNEGCGIYYNYSQNTKCGGLHSPTGNFVFSDVEAYGGGTTTPTLGSFINYNGGSSSVVQWNITKFNQTN